MNENTVIEKRRKTHTQNSDKFSDFYLILAPVNITKSKGNEDLAADVSALWLFIMDDFISQWCDKVKETKKKL